MGLPKIEEVRKLNDAELAEQIKAVKRDLFELRFKQSTNQLENQTHKVKHAKHRQAQMLTVQRERELAAARTMTPEPETPATPEVVEASVTSAPEVAEASVAAAEE